MKLLIGHNGSIGEELKKSIKFDFLANSTNIRDATGKSFSLVVCAAPSASMFLANKNPQLDLARIESLVSALKSISAQKFVLISSIAVLKNYEAQSEQNYKREVDTPYGKNRSFLETFCLNEFNEAVSLRLPSLFGSSIRKNFFFDILNPVPSMLTREHFNNIQYRIGDQLNGALTKFFSWNDDDELFVLDREKFNSSKYKNLFEYQFAKTEFSSLRFTSPNSCFQPYFLGRLHADLFRFMELDSSIIHIAPPPILAADIFKIATGKLMPNFSNKLHQENMKTRFGKLFENNSSPYMFCKESTLKDIQKFFKNSGTKRKWSAL